MENFKSTMISNYYSYDLCNRDNLLQIFHQNTKHSNKYLMANMYRSRLLLNNTNFKQVTSSPEKHYPLSLSYILEKHSRGELEDLLENRRSQVTKLSKKTMLTKQSISDLFWSAYGLNLKNTRTAPSGGALYPCEVYGIIFNDAGDLKKGLYHFVPSKNSLELMSQKDNIFNISDYMMMDNLKYPSLIFFITAVFDRTFFKYDARGYRYTLLEAGAIAQNISLMATKYSKVSTSIGGTDDFEVEKILGIDGINESLVNCVFLSSDGNWENSNENL